MNFLTHQGYDAGHPWFYHLGGDIPPLKAILTYVEAGEYRGYLADEIDTLNAKAEPKRSIEIRVLRKKLLAELRADISRYRGCARELRAFRQNDDAQLGCACADIHTAISLKFNHIVNGFANLRTLDGLPRQGDLFEGL